MAAATQHDLAQRLVAARARSWPCFAAHQVAHHGDLANGDVVADLDLLLNGRRLNASRVDWSDNDLQLELIYGFLLAASLFLLQSLPFGGNVAASLAATAARAPFLLVELAQQLRIELVQPRECSLNPLFDSSVLLVRSPGGLRLDGVTRDAEGRIQSDLGVRSRQFLPSVRLIHNVTPRRHVRSFDYLARGEIDQDGPQLLLDLVTNE